MMVITIRGLPRPARSWATTAPRFRTQPSWPPRARKSDHIDHVSTQLPYACLVAVVCLVFYAIASVVQSVIVTPFAIAAMVGILFLMKKLQEKKAPSKSRKA